MCGIIGYIGDKKAAPILLDGLSKLEYRGYDSSGVAVNDGKNIIIEKAKGKLKELSDKIDGGNLLDGAVGIGHTRWATHGEPSVTNAHPHLSDDGKVVGVHNGIIENYQEIKKELLEKGYDFYSQTDTEVLVKFIDSLLKDGKSPVEAVIAAMKKVRGSYALALMIKGDNDAIYVARKDSPMIIGTREGETFLASDVPAILKYTNRVYYIGDYELAKLERGKVTFYDMDLKVIDKELKKIEWSSQVAEKSGYDHFMLKEIHEQPLAVKNTISSVLKSGKIDFSSIGLTDDEIRDINQIHIVACGSAYHAGLIGGYVIEDLSRIPVRVELASEFRYRKPILKDKDLVIVVSQSGETADTLAALREAKSRGIKNLAIVNVVGSSIARDADEVFYTLAGPEISVATTKAYSTQLAALYTLAVKFAEVRKTITGKYHGELISSLSGLADLIEETVDEAEAIKELAFKHKDAKDIFFIGRGIDYAISMEGSLKTKEISYIHSEAYAAGELKHGTISLIEDGTLVIGTLTQDDLYEKTLSNMVECKSRGAVLFGLAKDDFKEIEKTVDAKFFVRQTDSHFMASLAVIILQMFGYYISVAKGLDVDKPRNLAKSVTVE